MANRRDAINIAPLPANSDQANREIERSIRRQDEVGLWSSDETMLKIIVTLDGAGRHYTPEEEMNATINFETVYYTQPPFIHIRTRWPSPPLDNIPNKVIPMGPWVTTLPYARTPRHSSYDRVEEAFEDGDWWAHLVNTHNFLIRLQNCEPINGADILSILRAQTQDLAKLIYIPSRVFTIRPATQTPQDNRSLALHVDDVGGTFVPFQSCEDSPSNILRGLYKRRLFAAMVEVDEDSGDWVSIIFDRKFDKTMGKIAHLYIFDPNANNRQERAFDVVQMWRQVLREIGHPYDFVAYVLPLSTQPNHWAIGYVAAFCLLQTLRGTTGQRVITLLNDKEVDEQLTFLPNQDLYPELTPRQEQALFDKEGGNSDLRFRDWCIDIDRVRRTADLQSSLNWVLTHLVGCAAMELGIANSRSFNPAPLRDITFDLKPLRDNDWSTLKTSAQMTMFGGFNPIIPRSKVNRRFGSCALKYPCHTRYIERIAGRVEINPINRDKTRRWGGIPEKRQYRPKVLRPGLLEQRRRQRLAQLFGGSLTGPVHPNGYQPSDDELTEAPSEVEDNDDRSNSNNDSGNNSGGNDSNSDHSNGNSDGREVGDSQSDGTLSNDSGGDSDDSDRSSNGESNGNQS